MKKYILYCLVLIASIAFNLHAQVKLPVANYPLDGNLNDASGNGHNGSTTSLSYGADRSLTAGKSAIFNGISQKATIPNAGDLSFGQNDSFTICFWMKAQSANPYSTLLSKCEESIHSGYTIGFDDTGRLRFLTNLVNPLTTLQAISLNTWLHVTVTYANTFGKIYINGVLNNSGTMVGLSKNNFNLVMGNIYNTTTILSQNAFYNGLLDEMRIYNSLLSTAEILAIYNMLPPPPPKIRVAYYPLNGNYKDSSGNGHDGSGNSLVFGPDRKSIADKAAIFNGISQKVIVPAASDLSFGQTDSFTISFWMKALGAGNYNTILSKCEESNVNGYTIGFDDSGKLRFLTNLVNQLTTLQPISLNTWLHVTVTYANTTGKIYINGVLNNSGNMVGLNKNNFGLVFGHIYSTTTTLSENAFYNGSLDEVRIYNYVLLPSEIMDGYNTGIKQHEALTPEIIVYPTFASSNEKIHIKVVEGFLQEVNIINSLGEIVKTDRNSNDILLTGLSSGIYYLQIRTIENDKPKSILKKFIVTE